MDLDIQVVSVDPAVERLRKREAASRRMRRMAVAASFTGGVTWLTAGALIFGVEWVYQLPEYLLAGFTFGAFLGALVVCYTVRIEVTAAIKGKRAVWTTDSTHSRPSTFGSYLRTKVAFAMLTVLTLGVCGALVASSVALIDDLNTRLGSSVVLMVLTGVTATSAAVYARSSTEADVGTMNDGREHNELDG